ncbi:uncharacterized protein JN550_000503 [Neoarthrinium moseri]|uniref:uncharacterized protein n=1 Tax=Neoarthrinium moseri TaxID=1658444 RepID=UPI001FDD62CA|nr:uncharacterized protein JN550_000503 [Neoarthrinium moseri]KAI1878321.1 hypothetical protein JN550_000503 [Neoarthrinium moseri]
MASDNGYVKPSSSDPIPRLQIPSNVTRISRAFARTCSDGTFQIIYYQSGVGSRTGFVDMIAGGAFGIGIAENIREAYSYICANYVDGDEIILVGFSRGAFTARSIAGIISDLGLLTREGMEYFYPVFKDMQNWMDYNYRDPFPELPFPNKPKGSNASSIYRERLVENKLSRVLQDGGAGELIKVKAIGVWDTVGSLGIPDIKFLSRLGIHRSTEEFTWFNTSLSPKIDHAFHALAIDEKRGPFSPALWERLPGQTTDLRQVWFPGSHTNIGGGCSDQGVANITLAWMMDQLSSVGVEFIPGTMNTLFARNVDYYKSLNPAGEKSSGTVRPCCGAIRLKPKYWATKEIYASNNPIRPWALHKIETVESALYDLIGTHRRSPGMYKRVNPNTGRPTAAFLEHTNERVHSSVRARLACHGLAANDGAIWKCKPVTKLWRPRRVAVNYYNPISDHAEWGPQNGGKEATDSSNCTGNGVSNSETTDLRWVWEYIGPETDAPEVRTMVEENLGPFEKHLLQLSGGHGEQVCKVAEQEDFSKFKFPGTKKA